MAEKAKLYWLQLKADFFKRSDIQLIKAMPNGREYALFYVELLCESLNRYGELRATETIPYNVEMLAAVTQENPDMVRTAITVFEQLGLIEVLDDGAYFMREVENMIGSASASPEAIRQREHRKKLKANGCDTSVTNCHENIEIRDKSIEIRDKNIDSDMGVQMYDIRTPKKRASRFSPPTIEEVRAYCAERGNNVDAEKFIDFYTSNGWKVGKNSMKDWKAAVRTWERNGYSTTSSQKQETYGERRERETMEMLQAWKDQADTML